MKTITNAFEIMDSLAGLLSGDYKKDRKWAEKQFGVTFSQEDYQCALQLQEQP